MKIVTIIGARPQFIKAAVVSKQLSSIADEIIVHTGQHYDHNMSDVFFEELEIPKPMYQLGIGSGNHGEQTGHMLEAIEKVLLSEKPDALMVYGDTNSTLAGALAASKLLIPVLHVEAGLRSFNKVMPEEQNRILTDHLSQLLFAPTDTAVTNLEKEGIVNGVHLVGDVMYDGILHFSKIARSKSQILEQLQLIPGEYILSTVHRAENTNDPERLRNICLGLGESGKKIILPLHPRTQKYLDEYTIRLSDNITVTEPLGYLDMVQLEANAAKIVTDSGGVQKEAFFLGKPCITLREETEWVETVQNGWNLLAGARAGVIAEALTNFEPVSERKNYFGAGDASLKITSIISDF